jgi:prepilin signal peptidase PulO-like enzyme (type II secretory pathway)
MLLVIIACLVLAALGLVMGSFAGAQVWRLRARQLVADKAAGEPYDKDELKRLLPLTKAKLTDDRSHCLRCQHVLRWYDLVPLVSWLSTKGRCRYCHKPIGRFEPLIELGTAVAFGVFSYAWFHLFGLQPVGLALLALWLAALTMLVILFVYDLKWFLLPDKVMFPLIGLSVVIAGLMLKVVHGPSLSSSLLSIFSSILILSGIYFVLWLISQGRWVGFGDVKLGLALGILLGDWQLALLALFLANLIGTLVVLPSLIRKKMSRQTQVPFGPMLILGFFISLIFGHVLIDAYSSLSIWLTSTLLML